MPFSLTLPTWLKDCIRLFRRFYGALLPTATRAKVFLAGTPVVVISLLFTAYQLTGVTTTIGAHLAIIVAGLILVVALWETLLSANLKYARALAILGSAILGYALWYFDHSILRQKAEQERASASSKIVPLATPFRVEIRSALISNGGPLTMFMVGYPTMYGHTISPVFYLFYIQITNLQDVLSTISYFKVEVGDDSNGPWENLMRIPLYGKTLYSLNNSPFGPKTLSPNSDRRNIQELPAVTIPYGAYFIYTPMTIEHMRWAKTLVAESMLKDVLIMPIQPHGSINEWVALDAPANKRLKSHFRITLHDSADKGGSYVIHLPTPEPGDPSANMSGASFKVTGETTDISGFKVKYYSDPYPRPSP